MTWGVQLPWGTWSAGGIENIHPCIYFLGCRGRGGGLGAMLMDKSSGVFSVGVYGMGVHISQWCIWGWRVPMEWGGSFST